MSRELVLVATFFALVVGCAGQAELPHTESVGSSAPNIVFAIADDWGWPHAGAYGDRVVQTPSFDRLAHEGALFEHAYVSSPSCTPSRGAILTGQDFFRLGAGGNLWSAWPSGFPEYPRLLAQAGYFVGSYRKGWGPGSHPASVDNPAGKNYENVEAFFEARPAGQPFSLWFGSTDPHRPYERGSGLESGMDPSEVHLFGHFPDVPEVRSDIADYYWEVQRFDSEVGALLDRLEAMGELDDTIVVMTGDHGMPFPRAKGNLYDAGTRVPLAVRWPGYVPAGRRVTDFVSLTDIAPTFLEVGSLEVPTVVTGRSLLPLLSSEETDRVGQGRDQIIFGRERHVPAQEDPDSGGYPMRAIRTGEYLFIRNYRTDRWPAGTPNYEKAYIDDVWLGDCDNGPTKTYLWKFREEPEVRRFYELAFSKRPAEELYDLKTDPQQLINVASDARYEEVGRDLDRRLSQALKAARDPRALGDGDFFDEQEYLGSGPKMITSTSQ